MAWRSGGSSNHDMVSNLKRFGVIRTQAVEDAFQAVDRRFFVPQNRLDLAHSDQPLKEGNVHISAPHIYGCIVEALDLTPNASLSFLNIGSGTGYLSTIVAKILGPTSVCYGVEIHRDAIQHCMASMERWNAENNDLDLPHMEFIHGNGLQIDAATGEPLLGFDRIYVGASVERSRLNDIASLLRPGGVLVGPVDDELVKVLRLSKTDDATPPRPSPPLSLRRRTAPLSEDFTQQVISGVRFAPLLSNPSIPTVIRSRIWDPSVHRYYPESFKKSCKEILLCANAPEHQPPPKVVKKQTNVSAQLPRNIWVEILSYTQRDWFEPRRSVEEGLRRQLEEQRQALQRAQEARADAEARLRTAERERDGYRMLAMRWQTRLRALTEEDAGASGETENGGGAANNRRRAAADILRRDPEFLRLGGINAIIRHFQEDSSDEEDEGEDNGGMEEDSEDDGASSAMEEVGDDSDSESTMAVSPPTVSSVMHVRPARAVSISAPGV